VLDESPKTWVFWVHAGTQARFKEGYRNIAKKVKISNWDDPKTDIMRVVSNWLCDASNGRWVMIVDNADDASVFLHNTPASFTAYKSNSTLMEPSYSTFLPHTVNGSILVTSRSREVARMLTGSESSVIDIGPLDSQEALTLLQKKFTFAVKGHEANALCSSLDYMPLALTQAAAFINRTPRMSIPKYLREIYHDRARLLDEDLVDIRRDEGVSNSILTTWQISFDQIRERSPAAARLLSLMSLFDRHSIPEWLLRSKYGGCRNENSCFEDDVDTLTGYSFIKPSADGSSFDMHGLVQSSTKRWLEQQSELLYWKEIFVSLMDKSYPVGRSENLPVCQALLPHAQAALNNVPRDEDALEEWASLSFKLAWYVGDMGDYSEAYKLALDSYDVRRLLWGADAPLTLDSLNSLALVLNKLGRYDEAREMHQRALEAKERTLGAESSDTLCTMVNLASLYNDECKWVDAEELLTRVLHISNKLQKVPNYPLRLDALTLLATVYRDQGRWTDAAKLELQILEARKTDLGANHPVTLAVTSNLAFTYRKLGLLKEAEEMQLRIIDSCESRQGAEIDVLCYKAHLASTYRAQGRLDDAEKLELQVLETSQTKLGLNHFDTMIRMAHLASTYWKAGKLKEAQELDEQTLELRRKNLGDDHLSTLDSKANLAMTYKSQGLYDKAERLENEVLEAHMKNLGEDHPMTLNSKVHLASTYREQGRLLEAEKFNEHVLQTRTRILGPDHPDTLSSMSYLAVTYKHQKRVSKAIELMEKCSKTYERALGPDGLDMMGYKKTFERWKTESEQAAEIVSVSPTI
jgi:tetratricopeptide (TPR) repeat protein